MGQQKLKDDAECDVRIQFSRLQDNRSKSEVDGEPGDLIRPLLWVRCFCSDKNQDIKFKSLLVMVLQISSLLATG